MTRMFRRVHQVAPPAGELALYNTAMLASSAAMADVGRFERGTCVYFWYCRQGLKCAGTRRYCVLALLRKT